MTRTDWRRIAVSRCLCGLVTSNAGVPCIVLIYVWIIILVPFPEQVNKFDPYHHIHAYVSEGLNDAIRSSFIPNPGTHQSPFVFISPSEFIPMDMARGRFAGVGSKGQVLVARQNRHAVQVPASRLGQDEKTANYRSL